MAFPKPPSMVPTRVGIIEITLTDFPAVTEPPSAPASRAFQYRIYLYSATGEVVRIPNGDLTAGQLNALNAFLDAMRVKAEAILV